VPSETETIPPSASTSGAIETAAAPSSAATTTPSAGWAASGAACARSRSGSTP
jgi:hypothetical protein